MSLKRAKSRTPTQKVRVSRAVKVDDSRASMRAGLLPELRQLIRAAHYTVAVAMNSALATLYWQIGSRIRIEILGRNRAEYGQQIVATLRRQLGWAHFKLLIPLKDSLRRDFYAEMCRIEGWSTRMLQQKIDGMLYERTALSKKPTKVIAQELQALRAEDKLTPNLVFKDPYVLDFLGLHDTYSEKDLEAALLREIERFLLELGAGFAFVERQKRIVVDGEDFYMDLLFYHRRLRRLVLVELKLGAFKAADFGQTQLYLRWLDRFERQAGESPPIGLILCADKSKERIELLELEQSGIRVAQYLTELPPRRCFSNGFIRRWLKPVQVWSIAVKSKKRSGRINPEEDETRKSDQS